MRTHKLLSVVFLTFAICSIFSCNLERVPETFLIDKDFRGLFYIVYNQKGGQKKKFEGESRVYEIPKTGVLFTEFEEDHRSVLHHDSKTRQRFYFVDEHGTRKEITEWIVSDFEHEASVNLKMVSYARDSVAAFYLGGENMGVDYRSYTLDHYFIGPYDQMKKTNNLGPEYIDSLRSQQSK